MLPYFTSHETEAQRRRKPEVALRNFHSRIKGTLYESGKARGRLLDLAAGRGADCKRYGRYSEVVALDTDGDALTELRRRVTSLPITTVHADFTQPLPPGLGLFDCVSTMFCVHYACQTVDSLTALVSNVADSLKLGGVYIGIDMDGDEVVAALGVDGNKRYTDWAHLSLRGECLSVYIESIGGCKDEWLVRWPLFRRICEDAGMQLRESNVIDPGRQAMHPELKAFSRLHRWWIFHKCQPARGNNPK